MENITEIILLPNELPSDDEFLAHNRVKRQVHLNSVQYRNNARSKENRTASDITYFNYFMPVSTKCAINEPFCQPCISGQRECWSGEKARVQFGQRQLQSRPVLQSVNIGRVQAGQTAECLHGSPCHIILFINFTHHDQAVATVGTSHHGFGSS